jgi:adenylate cyclase
MLSRLDYTSRARKISYKYPKLSYIGIQVNFWIAAFLLFSTITYMNTLYIARIGSPTFPLSYELVILNSIFMGLMFGVVLGRADLILDRLGIGKLSIGLIIIIRVIVYQLVLLLIIVLTRFVLVDWVNVYFDNTYSELLESPFTWRYLYGSLFIYTSFMAVVISFVNQMNNKFGPGILIPLLLGRYRSPKEQERFFMFVDLKSSARHAEDLGHLKYSSMIRDCFIDLNQVLVKNSAEIYQYVGDEAVITWLAQEGMKKQACLSFFFDFNKQLFKRKNHYLQQYGVVPEFKAGLHFGIITAVEVGQIRREIAYHGDTINTAARIQSMCNHFDKSFLISESAKSIIHGINTHYRFESLGPISLKGKDKAVELFSVDHHSA